MRGIDSKTTHPRLVPGGREFSLIFCRCPCRNQSPVRNVRFTLPTSQPRQTSCTDRRILRDREILIRSKKLIAKKITAVLFEKNPRFSLRWTCVNNLPAAVTTAASRLLLSRTCSERIRERERWTSRGNNMLSRNFPRAWINGCLLSRSPADGLFFHQAIATLAPANQVRPAAGS